MGQKYATGPSQRLLYVLIGKFFQMSDRIISVLKLMTEDKENHTRRKEFGKRPQKLCDLNGFF
jgi:hypothetical protein